MFEERYPNITNAGKEMLKKMREHPSAPLYRNESGNRLTKKDLDEVIAYDEYIQNESIKWKPNHEPVWAKPFINKLVQEVPFYKKINPQTCFADFPTISRADLAKDIAQFVPDGVPIDRLINFRTTGTTGNPLLLASHPVVAAKYFCFHKKALQKYGITLTHGKGQVGVILVGNQKKCFTYVSVTPMMNESGLAKINLHLNDWRKPEDRADYLNDMAPEIFTGDPLSFAELLTINLKHKPKALISVGMRLLPGLKNQLMKKFSCPVLDIYSMNEAGPIGIFDETLDAYLLLQPDLYVEILDSKGNPLKNGERGEITLTGGFNFCLPLLRYRTGDFGALTSTVDGPAIIGLEGRPPVRFITANNIWINNIDISHALAQFPIAQFGLHQNGDKSCVLKLNSSAMSLSNDIVAVLKKELGDVPISTTTIQSEDKIIQYTSNFPGHDGL